jgi:hypothetical protein
MLRLVLATIASNALESIRLIYEGLVVDLPLFILM